MLKLCLPNEQPGRDRKDNCRKFEQIEGKVAAVWQVLEVGGASAWPHTQHASIVTEQPDPLSKAQPHPPPRNAECTLLKHTILQEQLSNYSRRLLLGTCTCCSLLFASTIGTRTIESDSAIAKSPFPAENRKSCRGLFISCQRCSNSKR